MRWNSGIRGKLQTGLATFLAGSGLMLAIFVVPKLFLAQSQADQTQLTVYSARTTYSLPVVSREGQEYIGLLELLEPLGAVSSKLERSGWRLRFGDREALFAAGKTQAQVNKNEIDLNAPFLIENGRGLVPLHALPTVLSRILASPSLDFHEPARRLFLDGVELHYTAELRKGVAGQLIITFSAPANPFIATEPGKLRMFFRREPLLPTGPGGKLSFDEKVVPSLVYSEGNGAAELTVNCSEALMAFFSADRKTITLAPVAPQAQSPTELPSGNLASMPRDLTGLVPPPATIPPARGFVVVIDAAHGGDDRGGTITNQVTEKELTLAFSRRLVSELQTRGITPRMLRETDTAIPLEQRAVLANAAVPSLYVAVHASASGTGIHVVTSNIAPAQNPTAFLPWNGAQAAFVGASQGVASDITTELLKHDIPAFELSAPIAPLNSIAAPAVAIELGAPSADATAKLSAASYQQSVSRAIAGAVAAARGRLPHAEGGR
jgi:N-acetylmuramoyl-L-alanine amidase